MKATDYMADALSRAGVNTIFGYQGSSIAHLIDSISVHPDITFVETRNEQGASFAANGYALAGNQLGAAVACSGPGALNLLGGIANAYYDSVPCLFLTGQVGKKESKPNPGLRQYGFQETDTVSIVRPITKYATYIDNPANLPHELDKAISIATSGRKGPVLLDLPHDIQNAEIVAKELQIPTLPNQQSATILEQLKEFSRRFRESRRPVILVGGGCNSVPFHLMKDLSKIGIPVITTYRGKGLIDNTTQTYCGNLGVFGCRAANWALKYSDFALCLGTRLDGRQTAYEPLQSSEQQNVVVFDIDGAELEKHPQNYLVIHCEAELAVRNILETAPRENRYTDWLRTVRSWNRRYPVAKDYLIERNINPILFLNRLSDLASPDANFVLDVGQNQLWANNSLSIYGTRRLIQSAGLGTMGFAIPAAIGAYYANGHQPISIIGDGGIQMNIQELQLAKAYDIPLKVFLLNNNCLGLIRDYQHKALGDRYEGSIKGFGSPDYSLIASAYSMKYEKIEKGNFDQQLLTVLADDSPWLIEVEIDQSSTACPEHTYGSDMLNQSPVLTSDELSRVRSEAYAV